VIEVTYPDGTKDKVITKVSLK
ncbi:rib/alpha/Esp surface antigen, partial [Enterococcus faecalis EnGen0245]